MTTWPPDAVLAVPKPRLRSCPDYTFSSGPDAVELAASIGLIADPWQEDALADALAERDDGRWASYEYAEVVGRQNGKGGIIEIRCFAGLHLFGEQLVIWSSHRWDTAMKMFRRIESRYESYDELRRQVKRINRSHGQEGIELLSGAELKFSTRSKDGGRGLSGDCVIIDEAYAFSDDHADAMIPVMSARIAATEGGPQILYHSSPPLGQVDATRDKELSRSAGLPMYRLRRRAAAGDPRLCYRDWSAVDADLSQLDTVDLDDRGLWWRSNPALGIRLSENWIESVERPQMSREGFARERLCLWPPEPTTLANDVLDPQQWARLADPGSQVDGDVALAVAVTLDRRWATIGLYARRADGLGHIEVVHHQEGTAGVAARLVQLRNRHDPIGVGIDLRGPAGALETELAEAGITPPDDADRPERGDLAAMTATDTAQACGQLVDAVRQESDRHIDQVQLASNVAAARTRKLGGALAWEQRSGVVDSPLLAVTAARWVYVTWIDKIAGRERQPGVWVL